MSFTHGKFRKLPIEVEAAQYPGHKVGETADIIQFEDWLEAKSIRSRLGRPRYRGQQLLVPTLEGEEAANPGDWIIVGVAGELYPCAREIFAQTYVRAQG